MVDAERLQAAKAIGGRMIEREMERCKKAMGDAEWDKHGDWVTANIVAAAKEWLVRQLAEGNL
jgi:hypothetical protein